jgi:hypothetical protein
MKITILSSMLMAISMSSIAAFTVNVQRVHVKSMGAQTSALFSEAPASTDSSPVSTPVAAAAAADSTPAAPAPDAPVAVASTDAAPAPVSASSKADLANPPVTNQPKYGKELGLPGTYVRCGRCATSYAIASEDLGTGPGRCVILLVSCYVCHVML